MKMRNGADSGWIELFQLDGEWSTIAFENGTAAAPSIYFKDSGTDTGFYSPGADQVGISTGGTSRLVVEADGDINIDSGGVFYDATNNRLAIGTTSPSEALTVGSGNVQITGGQLALGSLGSSGLQFINNGTIGTVDSQSLIFRTAATERFRCDTSGRLLVGTFSAIDTNSKLQIESDTNDKVVLKATSAVANNGSNINWYVGSTWKAAIYGGNDASSSSVLTFSTTADGASSPTERMRIAQDGRHFTFSAGALTHRSPNGSNSGDALFVGIYSGTSNTSGGTASFYVRTNGNVENTNDSYGAISDIKLKENIVDAESQWDDFKAVRFRKYNFKEETGHETFTQLGVIAQELELVSPGLVTETADLDEDGNDLGTTTKSVKYSILTKKALVALQEAMERIEQLEAKVAALEGV